MRGMTITEEITFEIEECIVCGMPFAMSRGFVTQKRGDGSTFFCPNGHSQVYMGKTWEQQIAEEKRRRAGVEEDLRIERASHSATRGQLTRTRTRAERAVCPHCRRSFANVARHMASQHPEHAHTPSGSIGG